MTARPVTAARGPIYSPNVRLAGTDFFLKQATILSVSKHQFLPFIVHLSGARETERGQATGGKHVDTGSSRFPSNAEQTCWHIPQPAKRSTKESFV